MAICKNCGQEIANGVKFCTRCGARNDELDSAPKTTIEPDIIGQSAPTQNQTPPPPTYQSAGYYAPPPPPAPAPSYQSANYNNSSTTVSFAPTGPKEQVNTAGIMVWSIITMLCCNVGSILGIFAVIFSLIAGVEKDFNSDKTKRYLQIAKVCNIVALVIGIIVAILYFTVFAGIIKELQELLSQVGTSTDGFNM